MKRVIFYLLIIIALTSCGSSSKNKAVISSKNRTTAKVKTTRSPNSKKIKSIVSYAKTFGGTRYKFGGTTRKGMDCSGLVYTSFKKENIILPRTSKTMATQGKAISLKKVNVGDLLFFKTNKRKNVISHVGLVVETKGVIKFIHASTSRGVIISSLDEKYWNKCFAGARRVL
ncbi:cell wall-associated NlpC family hydrolase [Aquimarina sp. EL_43]|uniref:C40 family peptidase n=1 Tax=Aquimarina TaxID=290174 RepID=UPI00046F9AB5|nr:MULTISPECIES: C40 family peptidase [Aquimarina]MBG6133625.1 cell wall-associated NlpC family hydrolase [Aquimarina sp. EL_35]MBG6152394.1 cell wall-associated NlpC family hydrolase [Aquimarina sp. EL_32]MBG6171998.1 cell wall-associated NlpC family hydrolase [Aquimarina sp. EL_43]